jgi:hypothetical protein
LKEYVVEQVRAEEESRQMKIDEELERKRLEDLEKHQAEEEAPEGE